MIRRAVVGLIVRALALASDRPIRVYYGPRAEPLTRKRRPSAVPVPRGPAPTCDAESPACTARVYCGRKMPRGWRGVQS